VPEAVSVAVLGASGYAGAIAAQLLHRHPGFELRHVTARAEAGQALDEVHPRTRVPMLLEPPQDVGEVDAAIVAYPHGAAAPVVAELRARGARVVDLSADFRLRDRATYEDWYGEHGAPDLFGQAVYGLTEHNRDAIREAGLVANPGCYPTAALLALHPFRDVIADVVIDAKSGISGAGREATSTTHFVSADENVLPYKVDRHRHTPEIEQELGGATITFVPHLVPLSQGELVSCYVTPSTPLTADDVWERLDEHYAREPFVELRREPPGVLHVRDSNFCRISATVDPRTNRILIFSAIDNLWKGAASQAVQNLNVMFSFDERSGLL
jgi:N-acetyl-gamma-glutamyl-phosphate reductase